MSAPHVHVGGVSPPQSLSSLRLPGVHGFDGNLGNDRACFTHLLGKKDQRHDEQTLSPIQPSICKNKQLQQST